jgi:hypothetical protein
MKLNSSAKNLKVAEILHSNSLKKLLACVFDAPNINAFKNRLDDAMQEHRCSTRSASNLKIGSCSAAT